MNINKPFSKLCVFLVAGVLLFGAFGSILGTFDVGEEPAAVEAPDKIADGNTAAVQRDGTRAPSPRTVLAELVTNWGCGPCANANPALNELCDVYGPDQLIMIAYHSAGPQAGDPFYDFNPTENSARYSVYYGVGSVPYLILDGTVEESGGGSGTVERYNTYKGLINTQLGIDSPLTITLEGYLDMMSATGYVNATIEVTDTLPGSGNLAIRFAVIEDNNYVTGGSNGEVRHRNAMRDMLTEDTLSNSLLIGETHSVSRSFTISGEYNTENLKIVVFVQNDLDKSVLQAAQYDYTPQPILVVDDDDSTNPDGWEDEYQELLSYMGPGFSFDSWVVNEAGSPSSALLSNYDIVLWVTADQTSSTLTPADQTAISTYLDSGPGSLFMCGVGIGSDIGGTSFYSDYLHASTNGTTNDFGIKGVTGDPIGDPFVGQALMIYTSTSDIANPVFPAATPFLFGSTDYSASVRADHDIDSKVVYLSAMYFEWSDPIDTKSSVMSMVTGWLTDMMGRIELQPGMNLISIPVVLFDTSLASVMNPIAGQYDAVQFFNASEQEWKHSHEAKPASMNDLTDLTYHQGFWVNIKLPQKTVYVCQGPPMWEPQVVHLYQGWNLVGFPSTVDCDRTTGLGNLVHGTDVEAVFSFNAELQQWEKMGPSDNFELGKGYWMYSNAEQDWNVPFV